MSLQYLTPSWLVVFTKKDQKAQKMMVAFQWNRRKLENNSNETKTKNTVCDVKQLTNSQTSTTVIVTEKPTKPTQSWLFLHTLLVFLHTPCQFSVKWVLHVNDLPCQTAVFPKDHHSVQKLQSLSTSSLLQFSNSYHRLIVSDSFWFFT